jgi:hypothetical protein
MRKLVLECIVLQPVSARGLQSLLENTLAAAEARATVTCSCDLTPQTPAKLLEACAFAALMQLNAQRLVSNFDDSSLGVLPCLLKDALQRSTTLPHSHRR